MLMLWREHNFVLYYRPFLQPSTTDEVCSRFFCAVTKSNLIKNIKNIKSMKKILLFVAMALQVVMANAFEGKVEIDGINYYILTKAAYAEVVSKDSGYEGDVVIPETVEYDGVVCTVKKIDNSAFSYDSKLTSISIPKTVTELGNYAFSNCKGLKKVIIDNLESWCTINIGDYANPLQYAELLIVGGKEIIDLVIPETITSIADRAFHGYKGAGAQNKGAEDAGLKGYHRYSGKLYGAFRKR